MGRVSYSIFVVGLLSYYCRSVHRNLTCSFDYAYTFGNLKTILRGLFQRSQVSRGKNNKFRILLQLIRLVKWRLKGKAIALVQEECTLSSRRCKGPHVRSGYREHWLIGQRISSSCTIFSGFSPKLTISCLQIGRNGSAERNWLKQMSILRNSINVIIWIALRKLDGMYWSQRQNKIIFVIWKIKDPFFHPSSFGSWLKTWLDVMSRTRIVKNKRLYCGPVAKNKITKTITQEAQLIYFTAVNDSFILIWYTNIMNNSRNISNFV